MFKDTVAYPRASSLKTAYKRGTKGACSGNERNSKSPTDVLKLSYNPKLKNVVKSARSGDDQ